MDDEDGFEHLPSRPVKPHTPSRDEQIKIAAARQYDDEQRYRREQAARAFLQSDPMVSSLIAGHDQMEPIDDRTKQLAVDFAAKTMAIKYFGTNLLPKQLIALVDEGVTKAREHEAMEREQALAKEWRQQSVDRTADPKHERPDYFIRNEALIDRTASDRQWLGKYHELDKLSRRPPAKNEPTDHVAREQRDASDRRQSPAIDPVARAERQRDSRHPPAAGETKIKQRQFTPGGTDRTSKDHDHAQDRGRGGRGGRER